MLAMPVKSRKYFEGTVMYLSLEKALIQSGYALSIKNGKSVYTKRFSVQLKFRFEGALYEQA